jgi:hypothetical protein
MSDPILSYGPSGSDNSARDDVSTTPAASRWEDFVDIFYAPSKVFARREHSSFIVPMLVVTVVGAAILLATFGAMSPIFDGELTRRFAGAKGMTAEQAATARKFSETIIKVMAFIAPPVMMFVTGLVLWLCGRFAGARQTLNAAVMVAAFANVPRLVSGLLAGVQAMLMDPATLTGRYAVALSPARFFDPSTASPVLLALLGRIDLFTIWATILLGIGLAVTGRIPRGRAFIVAAIVWVIGSFPDLMGALRQ